MLFNSYSFIFLFAPIVIGGYYWLGKSELRSRFANVWLVLASLYFYAHWNIKYLPLLLSSIAVNYLVSGWIIGNRKENLARTRFAFWSGVFFNVALLGVFKYTDFFIKNINLLGGDIPLLHIVLPLGISFFTITQLVYLVDCYEGLVKKRELVPYALFVSFFPHLLAGPILHHKPMMQQFADESLRRVNWENMARGLSLFIIGLAKKVLIADSFIPFVKAGFDKPESLSMIAAWLTVIAYMMQLYFDFSGYSDMAVGLARMLNIEIPINFNAPYRAYGIIDFWTRWHMSLSHVITNYLYTPMVMACKNITFAKSMVATFVTMTIVGFWHGAGWTYVFIGIIYGIALVVNHIWKKYHLWMWPPIGYLLTFLTHAIAFVFFRADGTKQAGEVLMAMAGGTGVSFPSIVAEFISEHFHFTLASGIAGLEVLPIHKLFFAILLIAFSPTSNDLIKNNYSYVTMMIFGAIFAYSIMRLSSITEFLYFQF